MGEKGIKGNAGKAARVKMSHQLMIIFALAVIAVTTIKAFGNAPWHSKAAHEEEHQISTPVDLKEVAKVVQKEEEPPKPIVDTAALQQESTSVDKNLIQIEFSHLDGKEDRSGLVVIKLIPEWAPIGVERFKELTAASFWEACRAFRVIPNFVVQLGINGNPEVQKFWRDKSIKDDEVKTTNARGTITFATSGANTRTSQIFFNIGKNNKYLDRQGFAPIGQVIKGMEIIDRIYAGYKEGPDQGKIQRKGNEYLSKEFPQLSFIKSAKFISPAEI